MLLLLPLLATTGAAIGVGLYAIALAWRNRQQDWQAAVRQGLMDWWERWWWTQVVGAVALVVLAVVLLATRRTWWPYFERLTRQAVGVLWLVV